MRHVLDEGLALEVDPLREGGHAAASNFKRLDHEAQRFFDAVMESLDDIPRQFHEISACLDTA